MRRINTRNLTTCHENLNTTLAARATRTTFFSVSDSGNQKYARLAGSFYCKHLTPYLTYPLIYVNTHNSSIAPSQGADTINIWH